MPKAWFSVAVVLALASHVLSSPVSFSPSNVETSASDTVGKLPWEAGTVPLDSFSGLIPLGRRERGEALDVRGMFYWYFPPQNGDRNAPNIVWLQGGPGSSSMLGLFYINGPLKPASRTTIGRAADTWNREFGMIFVDNPVGTGFSYARNQTYVKNEDEVADDFVRFMQGFYERHPDQLANKLYITGESYAGKYVPASAYKLLMCNELLQIGAGCYGTKIAIPLAGVAIGDGLTDPLEQIKTKAEQALDLGLVDEVQAAQMEALQVKAVTALERNDFLGALSLRNQIFDIVAKASGNVNVYDIRRYDDNDFSAIDTLLNLPTVKEALNVPADLKFSSDSGVSANLQDDIMRSTKNLFPYLLSKIPVMLYQGQFDYRDGVPESMAWIRTLPDGLGEGYLKANRAIWRVDGKVAGYAKQYNNLIEVEVIGAGHMAPMDAPAQTRDMITRLIRNVPFK